jgi:uncharacterized membrane protein YiaA
MQASRRHIDRLGAAMLVGALICFVVGAVVGLSSGDLASTLLLPFAGAAVGVLVAGTVGVASGWGRGRRQAVERAEVHERLRADAHLGWIEGIDLLADAPPPPKPRRARLR